jgi:hypothetical protein
MKSMPEQSSTGSADKAKQGAEMPAGTNWSWVEARVWTERMLSALGNGVKACPRAGRRPDPGGGKWYALIDKVYALDTLRLVWVKVQANQGAAGVDGQSVERSATRAQEKPRQAERDAPREDAAHPRAKPGGGGRRSQSNAQRLVRLLQARPSGHLRHARSDDPATVAGDVAQASAGRASAIAAPTINAGPMPTSRMPGCSHFTRLGKPRDSLDEETADWRAVCGKTARTVRRAGSAQADPDPYHDHCRRLLPRAEVMVSGFEANGLASE